MKDVERAGELLETLLAVSYEGDVFSVRSIHERLGQVRAAQGALEKSADHLLAAVAYSRADGDSRNANALYRYLFEEVVSERDLGGYGSDRYEAAMALLVIAQQKAKETSSQWFPPTWGESYLNIRSEETRSRLIMRATEQWRMDWCLSHAAEVLHLGETGALDRARVWASDGAGPAT